MADERMNGTVKWFDVMKNYGFIQGSDGKDYFVHSSEVPQGVRLDKEEKVTFEPSTDDQGRLKAKKILKE